MISLLVDFEDTVRVSLEIYLFQDTSYNSSTPGTVSNSSRRSSQSSNPPGRHTPNATSPQSVPPKSPALAAPTTNMTTPTSENKDTTPPLLSALTEDDNAIVQHIVDVSLCFKYVHILSCHVLKSNYLQWHSVGIQWLMAHSQ